MYDVYVRLASSFNASVSVMVDVTFSSCEQLEEILRVLIINPSILVKGNYLPFTHCLEEEKGNQMVKCGWRIVYVNITRPDPLPEACAKGVTNIDPVAALLRTFRHSISIPKTLGKDLGGKNLFTFLGLNLSGSKRILRERYFFKELVQEVQLKWQCMHSSLRNQTVTIVACFA